MEEINLLKKIILQKLIRSNIWGGKHTPLDFIIKSVPEHLSLNPRKISEIRQFMENN